MWSLWWTVVGFADILIFWGWCGSQLIFWIVRILHHGLLECMFGWVFHSDSVFKSDGYLWWWWWLLLFLTFYTLQIFLRSCIICSECRDIFTYILRFTLRTSEWVLPFWAYPVKYIYIYFIYSIVYYFLERFVPYIYIFPHLDFALVTK